MRYKTIEELAREQQPAVPDWLKLWAFVTTGILFMILWRLAEPYSFYLVCKGFIEGMTGR